MGGAMTGGGEADPVGAFRDALAAGLGAAPKEPIHPDGRLHRFHIAGDRAGTQNGFYILHLDDRPAGAYGCWKRGTKETWKANGAPLGERARAIAT